ncbi:MAG: Ca2+:H+ antiporter [Planctomycetota bacterium]|nr:MAG: Ca2+:H+ antiporter [Planctomycetota bacterium]
MNFSRLLKPSLDWLLVCIVLAIYAEHAHPESHTLIFLLSAAAIIPLAGWLGTATEHIAERAGEGIGGLLNATLGNAAEFIIALVALKAGEVEVVKASLSGSIIGNILLVMGASFLCGGMRHRLQEFNTVAAQTQIATLSVTSVALITLSVLNHLGKPEVSARTDDLSVLISVVLLATYGLSLWFSLRTHSDLFRGKPTDAEAATANHEAHWSMRKSLGVLAIATVFIAWMSEILVGSVSKAAESMGMSSVFIGVIVVALIGNAAEHSTAVMAAMKNRMDLAFGIAVGSSSQIALFVAPALVLLSYVVGPAPMNLVFSSGEGLAVILSINILWQVASDGRSHWFKGVLLLMVYVILASAFYMVV